MSLDTEPDARATIRRTFGIRGGQVIRKSTGEPPALDKLGRTTIRWAPSRGGYLTLGLIRGILSAKKGLADVPKPAPPKRRKRVRTEKAREI